MAAFVAERYERWISRGAGPLSTMLKRHSQFLESLMLLSDLLAISMSWIAAYCVRFYWGPVPVYRGVPGIHPYLVLLALIIIVWGAAFKAFGLYRPKRTSTRPAEVRDIAKASTLAVLILVALTFFFKQFEFSRLVILYFWVFSIVAVSFVRGSFREMLRFMRRSGYNLRHILIAGKGRWLESSSSGSAPAGIGPPDRRAPGR